MLDGFKWFLIIIIHQKIVNLIIDLDFGIFTFIVLILYVIVYDKFSVCKSSLELHVNIVINLVLFDVLALSYFIHDLFKFIAAHFFLTENKGTLILDMAYSHKGRFLRLLFVLGIQQVLNIIILIPINIIAKQLSIKINKITRPIFHIFV